MNTDFATDILRQLECFKPSHEETSEKHPLFIPICVLWEKIKLVTSILQFLISLKKGTLRIRMFIISKLREKKLIAHTRGNLHFIQNCASLNQYSTFQYTTSILRHIIFLKKLEWMHYYTEMFEYKCHAHECPYLCKKIEKMQNLEKV